MNKPPGNKQLKESKKQKASLPNPFSSRWIHPERAVYLFPPTETLSQLLQKLSQEKKLGQIVGPHGTGKSTLLSALVTTITHPTDAASPFAEETIWYEDFSTSPITSPCSPAPPDFSSSKKYTGQILRINLHDGQRKLPAHFWRTIRLHENTLILIDGFEQLSWFTCRQLKQAVQPQETGLLITTHTPIKWLPILYQTTVDPVRTLQLIHTHLIRLTETSGAFLADSEPVLQTDLLEFFNSKRIQQSLQTHDENVREVLFEMYDLFERWKRQP